MNEEVRMKNEERTTSDYMLEIAGHYLMNGCDDCPFYDIVKTCDSIPIHCNWMLLKNYFKAEEENPALSWDELKQMEGKPVWVVPEEEKGYWFVIEFFNNNPYYGGDRVIFTNDVILNRCDLGTKWQAYRKERV